MSQRSGVSLSFIMYSGTIVRLRLCGAPEPPRPASYDRFLKCILGSYTILAKNQGVFVLNIKTYISNKFDKVNYTFLLEMFVVVIN